MTNWLALWGNKSGSAFWTYTIKKNDIPAYSNLIVIKNKKHKKGDNRPPFICKFDVYDKEKHTKRADLHEVYEEGKEVVLLDDAVRIAQDYLYAMAYGGLGYDDAIVEIEQELKRLLL